MNVTVEIPDPTPVYTITLNRDEAAMLAGILGKIRGGTGTNLRSFTSDIYQSLINTESGEDLYVNEVYRKTINSVVTGMTLVNHE